MAMELEQLGTKGSLSENTQTTQVHFAMARRTPEKLQILHQWILCRDFLNEVIYTHKSKIPAYVHGFSTENMGELEKSRMHYLMKFKSEYCKVAFLEKAKQMLPLFNHHYNEIKKTNVKDVSIGTKQLVSVTGSPLWQRIPALISFHTQVTRLIAGPGSYEADNFLDLWAQWRSYDLGERGEWSAQDIDRYRVSKLKTPQSNLFLKWVNNAFKFLRDHPDAKLLPLLCDYDSDDDDDDEDSEYLVNRDNTVDIHDFHDSAGWLTVAKSLKSSSWSEYHRIYPKYKCV